VWGAAARAHRLTVVVLVLREGRRGGARAIAATVHGPRLDELDTVAPPGAAELPYGTLADPINEPPSLPIEDQGDAS
jgi:hypothetical protein